MKTMSMDNHNMENKLRHLESQSLPDLSHQDKHWQEMKNLLTPAAVPSTSPAISKSWRWIMAACVAVVFVLLLINTTKKQTADNKTIVKEKTVSQQKTILSGEKTAAGKDTTSLPAPVQTSRASTNNNIKPAAKEPVYAIPGTAKKCNCKDDWLTDTVKIDATFTDAVVTEDKGTTLAAFFAQLEKPLQEFVIDNKRDTMLYGKEGTALLIPANSFNTNGKVTISLKEYYSYEDIITNKLSTMSDGSQLETGGMLYITASVNGQEVALSRKKSIRWFLPDTSADINGMQLFTGTQSQQKQEDDKPAEKLNYDTAAIVSGNNGPVNWRPTSNGFANDFINLRVRAIDLRDLPFKTVSNKKYKAYYYINSESSLSKEELRDSLQKKYPYYDKIIIAGKRKKKEWAPTLILSPNRDSYEIAYSIGDTAWLHPAEAKVYKLSIIDTLAYTNRSSTSAFSASVNSELKKVASKYSVDINKLGWVNCDRFYNDNRPKVEYVVNLNDEASGYYTVLVFDRIKSMMSGYLAGNKVVFSGVPSGETARVISVGVKKGKAVSAMRPVRIAATILNDLQFEETTPSSFKETAAALDK